MTSAGRIFLSGPHRVRVSFRSVCLVQYSERCHKIDLREGRADGVFMLKLLPGGWRSQQSGV